MIATKTLLTLLTVATAISARVVPRKSPPAGWWTEGLEDYNAYHTRYLALGCQNYHGQAFFDQCCHPLKKDQTLESARPAQCIPSASASSSASLAEPTSTVTTPDDEPPTSVTTSASVSASASASPVANVANDDGGDDCEEDDDDDDDDDEDCEEDDDSDEDSSSFSSTIAPTSTKDTSSTIAAFAAATSSVKVFAPESTSSTSTQASSTYVSSSKSSKASSTRTSSTVASSSTSSASDGPFTGGFATYYYQNNVQSACGGPPHSDEELIAAIDAQRYGYTGVASDLCGKKVNIKNTDNGKTVTVTIADACPTCLNENSIDLSTAAFSAIADLSTGQVPISWEFA